MFRHVGGRFEIPEQVAQRTLITVFVTVLETLDQLVEIGHRIPGT